MSLRAFSRRWHYLWFSATATKVKGYTMNLDEMFSTGTETIDIHGIDPIIKFSRFHPRNENIFCDGLELAEDLKMESGTTLYTKGTFMKFCQNTPCCARG